MGVFANLRGSITQQVLPLSSGASSSSSSSSNSNTSVLVNNNNKKKWCNCLPLLFILVVVAEICFLGRLDMANSAAFIDWADRLFYNSHPDNSLGFNSVDWPEVTDTFFVKDDRNLEPDKCEEWLEKEDAVVYSRDFNKNPVFVFGSNKDWKTCDVGCHFGFDSSKRADAVFDKPNKDGPSSVLRSMEAAQYYPVNDISQARRTGYNVVMTTSLSSDVPVGYFSWAEYDITAPLQPKPEKALAAAFISNCVARSFRLQALEALIKANVQIDSYGRCHRNKDGRVSNFDHGKLSVSHLSRQNR